MEGFGFSFLSNPETAAVRYFTVRINNSYAVCIFVEPESLAQVTIFFFSSQTSQKIDVEYFDLSATAQKLPGQRFKDKDL